MNTVLMDADVDNIINNSFMEKTNGAVDLYVVSTGINSIPSVVFKNAEKAKEFVDKVLTLFRNISPDWEISVREKDNTFVVTRRYRWFLMKYDEVILTLSIRKTWGVFSGENDDH